MEFFAESTVKGRKEHCCDACRKPIEVGIVHSYMRMKYDGDFSAVRNHMECREAECDLAKQAGVWGPEDWLFLHDLEREDAEWVKAKHPIAWSRIADRYAYLDEEDQPMTNEPKPNTRAGEALKPCKRCGAACRIEVFDSERVKATIWMCSNHSHFGGTCPDQNAYLSEQDWNTRPLPQPSELVETPEAFNKKKERCLAYVEQHWKWGNLTRLGIVNQLVRDGFRQTWAIEQADRIAPAANQAVAHITQLEAQIAKLQADGDKLAGALDRSRQGWSNVLELGLLPVQHQSTALELQEAATQALTEWKDRA